MNAVRHSPLTFMARRFFSNALEVENSSPRPAWNLTRLSYPYQSMSCFCQVRSLAHAGSLPSVDLPLSSTHLPPNIGPKLAGVFEYQPMSGLKPTTFSEPSGLRTVSFLAYSVSCEIVFGGPLRPAFLSMSSLT